MHFSTDTLSANSKTQSMAVFHDGFIAHCNDDKKKTIYCARSSLKMLQSTAAQKNLETDRYCNWLYMGFDDNLKLKIY